ncbi:hypothetical protein D046_2842B, partial [Vibrio parahaemolyticus V-223/04]
TLYKWRTVIRCLWRSSGYQHCVQAGRYVYFCHPYSSRQPR